ncbi:MAG: hypothetical protein ACI4QL_04705, partial [Candidatus Fimimonas sp.]
MDSENTPQIVAEEQQVSKKRRKRVKLPADLSAVERFDAPISEGLNETQLQSRLEQGFVNVDYAKRGKSIGGIIFSNIFTFFNVIYMIIATILCIYGLANQCTFLPVVLANTAIAIVQEIKSKITLDKLNLITEPKVTVVRNGAEKEISVNELVLDDVVHLSDGAQISADC